MMRDGLLYSDTEKAILDWVASKVETVQEMEKIAPLLANQMQRSSVGAIQKQIEDRKREAGHKEFFWSRN